MKIEELLPWIQASAFIGTGLGVLFKLNAFTVRLELIIKNHAKRIKKLEKDAQRRRREKL